MGAHEFSEAELSALGARERQRCFAGLTRLRTTLNADVPARRYERNLLVANWPLRKFGAQAANRYLSESLFYMAQVIGAFDLIALQEIDRNLARLEALLDILGPDWSFLVSDVAPGAWGNNERFALVYYRPRVEFRHFTGNLILPAERPSAGSGRATEQLARPPLLAAFRAGSWDCHVCTTHIVWGGDAARWARRVAEVQALGRYLRARARYDRTDLLLMGDFNYERPGSPVYGALIDCGIQLPEEVVLPAHVRPGKYFGLVGFASAERKMPLAESDSPAGVIPIYEHVLRDEDVDRYIRTAGYRAAKTARSAGSQQRLQHYQSWRTRQISDHLPLWVELSLPEAS